MQCQVRKWESRAWGTPASGSSMWGGSKGTGFVGAWARDDPVRWGGGSLQCFMALLKGIVL